MRASLPRSVFGQLALVIALVLVGAGVLAVLLGRYYSVGQLAGAKAVEILAGGKSPATIPVERLKRFSLLVNMRVAHSLRLYPPIDMLNYAEVIAVGDAPPIAS